MIKINLIPQEQRRSRGGFWDEGFGPLPREVLLGVVVAAAGLLLVVHVALALVAFGKVTRQVMLAARWHAMDGDKKTLDMLTDEAKDIQGKMSALKVITASQGMSWGHLLNDLSDSVPKGVWLRRLRFENGGLTIEGSAFSKAQNEMINANNFVAALKTKPSFKEYFTGIDVDSIRRRENTPIAIADFSLKAKKEAP